MRSSDDIDIISKRALFTSFVDTQPFYCLFRSFTSAVLLIPDGQPNPFECKVCMSLFNTTDRKPKSLPCGHSLCEECTDQLPVVKRNGPNHSVECPFCRQLANKKCIVPNRGLLDILAHQSTSETSSSSSSSTAAPEPAKACDVCRGESVNCSSCAHCFDCVKWLCEGHSLLHSQRNKSHRLASTKEIEGNAALKARAAASKSLRFCTTHPTALNNALTQFCEHCSVYVCNVCAVGSHMRHPLADRSVIWSLDKVHATRLISTVQPKVQLSKQSHGDVTQAISRLEAVLTIQQFDMVHQVIDRIARTSRESFEIVCADLIAHKATLIRCESELQTESDLLESCTTRMQKHLAEQAYVEIRSEIVQLQALIDSRQIGSLTYVGQVPKLCMLANEHIKTVESHVDFILSRWPPHFNPGRNRGRRRR